MSNWAKQRTKSILESWRSFLIEGEEELSCPAATEDLKLNTKNRDMHKIKASYRVVSLFGPHQSFVY